MNKLIAALLIAPGMIALAACDVDQTQEGELPEVEVTPGTLPEFEVELPKVEVGTKETTVEVPTVDITMPGDDDSEPGTEYR